MALADGITALASTASTPPAPWIRGKESAGSPTVDAATEVATGDLRPGSLAWACAATAQSNNTDRIARRMVTGFDTAPSASRKNRSNDVIDDLLHRAFDLNGDGCNPGIL